MIGEDRRAHALRAEIVAAEQHLRQLSDKRDELLIRCVLDEGWSYVVAGEAFGLSKQRVAQIIARHRKAYPVKEGHPGGACPGCTRQCETRPVCAGRTGGGVLARAS